MSFWLKTFIKLLNKYKKPEYWLSFKLNSLLQIKEIAFLCHQLVILPTLSDSSFIKHVYYFWVSDCIESMSNANACFILHYLVQTLLYFLLISTIEGRSCFIKQKYLGFSQDSSSYCNSLLLTSWNMGSFYTNWSVKACLWDFFLLQLLLLVLFRIYSLFCIISTHNKIVGICLFSSWDYLFFSNICHIVFDILFKTCVKKDWFLTDYTKLRS